MSNQYRLGNRNNGDSPNRDTRSPRNIFASPHNSSANFSSGGVNSSTVGGEGTRNQPVSFPFPSPPTASGGNATNTNTVGSSGGGNHHHRPSTSIITFNDNHVFSSSSSPSGSTLSLFPITPSNNVVGEGTNNNATSRLPRTRENINMPPPAVSLSLSLSPSLPPRFPSSGIPATMTNKRGRTPEPHSTRGESSSQAARRRTLPQQNTNHVIVNNTSSNSSSPLPWSYTGRGTMYTGPMPPPSVAPATAGPNRVTTTRGPAVTGPTSFFDVSLPYDHYSSDFDHSSYLEANRLFFPPPPRQDSPWDGNFLRNRHHPSASAATRSTTPAPALSPPFPRNYNSFLSYGTNSSSSSSSLPIGMRSTTTTTTRWGQIGNNNNVDDFFANFQPADDGNTHSIRAFQQYVRLLPNGRVNQFVAPTLVSRPSVGSSSAPPSQPPLRTDNSSSNYRLNISLPFDTGRLIDRYIRIPTMPRSGNRRPRRQNNQQILLSTSIELRAERNRLRQDVYSSMQHLRNGGAVRIEDLLLLDYSIVLNLLDSQERTDRMDELLNESEDWPYEILVALEDQIGSVEVGLTEEEILTHMDQEIYQSSSENEACSICQEDYVEGERIGKLNCRHIYHIDCIKQWLLLKNVCPICKQTALDIDDDDD